MINPYKEDMFQFLIGSMKAVFWTQEIPGFGVFLKVKYGHFSCRPVIMQKNPWVDIAYLKYLATII